MSYTLSIAKKISACAAVAAVAASPLWAGAVNFEDVSIGGSSPQYPADAIGSDTVWTSSDTAFAFQETDEWGSWQGIRASKASDTSDTSYANQYASVTGSGSGGSSQYAVIYLFSGTPPAVSDGVYYTNWTSESFADMGGACLWGDDRIVKSIDITNTVTASEIFKNGNAFSDPLSAMEGSFINLLIRGICSDGSYTEPLKFTLGEFVGGNLMVCDGWNTFDLSGLGEVAGLDFAFSSNVGGGTYGISLPTYAAIDNLTFVPEPAAFAAAFALVALALAARRRRAA